MTNRCLAVLWVMVKTVYPFVDQQDRARHSTYRSMVPEAVPREFEVQDRREASPIFRSQAPWSAPSEPAAGV